ncbi:MULTISPECIES: glycosyltransferase family 2 protein [Calothrix]|uniref:Glycosyltransferase family 2 protein n=2 Tax=Calothrix TaxID=1186 RepID=A0ABR8AN44_9CYAN|nr:MULTISPECIES: glycosyltransferase family 2 protein [Calothrix]MBD2200062.1 glycosyltransferase family 2 protein [Calothrix parietina FACHB-288]MBD2229044.1 glycosyltransferase family 2 protein [Calothrix anomala FACHB-343]
MPKISVIVPVYQVEAYIADTISSVLAQTYSDFELLLIDDGSPDKSIDICRQFTDSRIKIISQQNRGLAGARNTGIRHAQGEYLAFLDSDDLWTPEKLEKHLIHLENSPSVGVSFSRSAFINETGEFMNEYQMPRLKDITPFHLLQGNHVGNGSAPVVRRKVFEEIKFTANLHGTVEDFYFDEAFKRAEDIECWLRVAIQTNWQIEGIPEALTLYRVNSQGLSASLLQQFDSWKQVLEKTRAYAPDLIAQWENLSQAYQLRYLARTSVRLRMDALAVKLIHQALKTHWFIIFEEPRFTISTLVAAYLLWLLPKNLYNQIEIYAIEKMRRLRRQPIFSDKPGLIQ